MVALHTGLIAAAGAPPGESMTAELLLAGNAVAIAIHFPVRTIAQEECGFLTGAHLRTMGPAVAVESRPFHV
jgi:hypothetical protein